MECYKRPAIYTLDCIIQLEMGMVQQIYGLDQSFYYFSQHFKVLINIFNHKFLTYADTLLEFLRMFCFFKFI